MNPDDVMDIFHKVVWLATLVSAPLLCAGLIVGVVVAILQAATQIQENALSFIPKLFAMGVTLVLCGPWCLDKLVGFTTAIITRIAHMSPGRLPSALPGVWQ